MRNRWQKEESGRLFGSSPLRSLLNGGLRSEIKNVQVYSEIDVRTKSTAIRLFLNYSLLVFGLYLLVYSYYEYRYSN